MNNNTEIIQNLLPDIVPLFSGHLARIVQFESDDLSDVNLALLLSDYLAEDYRQVEERLHDIIDCFSGKYETTFSIITVGQEFHLDHPLDDAINAGTVVWSRPIDEIIIAVILPKLLQLFGNRLWKVVKIDLSANVDVSIAIVTTGISEDEYLSLSDAVHKCFGDSGIVAAILLMDRDSLKKHPEDAEAIKNGTVLWQQEESTDV